MQAIGNRVVVQVHQLGHLPLVAEADKPAFQRVQQFAPPPGLLAKNRRQVIPDIGGNGRLRRIAANHPHHPCRVIRQAGNPLRTRHLQRRAGAVIGPEQPADSGIWPPDAAGASLRASGGEYLRYTGKSLLCGRIIPTRQQDHQLSIQHSGPDLDTCLSEAANRLVHQAAFFRCGCLDVQAQDHVWLLCPAPEPFAGRRCRKAERSAAGQGTALLSVPARPESAAGQSPGTRRWPGPKISPVPEARSAEGTAGLPPPPARQA